MTPFQIATLRQLATEIESTFRKTPYGSVPVLQVAGAKTLEELLDALRNAVTDDRRSLATKEGS